MKKIYKKIILALLIFSAGFGSSFLLPIRKNIVLEEPGQRVIKNYDTISMMLETEAGSGNYEMTTSSSWPTEGYVFNSELSKCENGGELSWDNTTKQVLMSSNVSDKCYVYFDKYNPITINNYSITSNGNSITITIDAISGTGTIAKYLYSKDNGVSYVQSANNTYTFTGLDKGTYNIKAYVQDSNGKNSETVSKTIEITSITLANYVISEYNGVQGNNNIYHHDGTLTNGINDGSYRYSGPSDTTNNYVCFGSSAVSCPEDNLYRIIGIIDGKARLIKVSYASYSLLGTDGDYSGSSSNYYYNYNSSNSVSTIWSTSLLNKTNLNTNFLNNIGTEWANKIAISTWKYGNNSFADLYNVTPSTAYQNEIANPTVNTTYDAKIGLLYLSDYGYAISKDYWTSNVFYAESNNSGFYKYNTTLTTANWMFVDITRWTMSSIIIYSSSNLNGKAPSRPSASITPVFSLNTNVIYVSGDGSQSSPIRIS